MNERIKILSEHAKNYAYIEHSNDPTLDWYKLKEEKFAELIVRECEQVSLTNSHRDDDMGAIIADKIKKHFGIEE